jgi:hypothetical protein
LKDQATSFKKESKKIFGRRENSSKKGSVCIWWKPMRNKEFGEYILGVIIFSLFVVIIPEMVREYLGAVYIPFLILWWIWSGYLVYRMYICPVGFRLSKISLWATPKSEQVDDKANKNCEVTEGPKNPPSTMLKCECNTINEKKHNGCIYCPPPPSFPIGLFHISSIGKLFNHIIKREQTKCKQNPKNSGLTNSYLMFYTFQLEMGKTSLTRISLGFLLFLVINKLPCKLNYDLEGGLVNGAKPERFS